MADPKDKTAPAASAAPAPAAAVEKREIPSFSKVAEESRDARSAELAGLAGIKPGGKTDPQPPAAADGDEVDLATWYGSLPESRRSALDKGYYDNYNRMLSEQWGDIMPLVAEVSKNPELRTTFAAIAKDPELIELFADPDARKMFGELSKKEQREFLFGEALTTYKKYATPAADARRDPAGDPRDERIAKLEQTMSDERSTRETNGYIENRRREVQALTSAFPDLAKPEAAKQLAHVIDVAEERFMNAAMQRGIKTVNADGSVRMAWPAEAQRAGVKPPSYREIHEMYAEVLGRTAPPAAPSTTAATPPAPAQAPRDASEGKTRALTLLKNSGGLKGLASASTRRR